MDINLRSGSKSLKLRQSTAAADVPDSDSAATPSAADRNDHQKCDKPIYDRGIKRVIRLSKFAIQSFSDPSVWNKVKKKIILILNT